MKGEIGFRAELRKAERSGLIAVEDLDAWQKRREDRLKRRFAERRIRIVADVDDIGA